MKGGRGWTWGSSERYRYQNPWVGRFQRDGETFLRWYPIWSAGRGSSGRHGTRDLRWEGRRVDRGKKWKRKGRSSLYEIGPVVLL